MRQCGGWLCGLLLTVSGVAATAEADENVQSPSCPFPTTPSVNADTYDERLAEACVHPDPFTSIESSGRLWSADRARADTFTWPSVLEVRLEGAMASTALDQAEFGTADGRFSVLGGELGVRRFQSAGSELVLALAPVEHLRVGIGGGLYGPFAGERGGDAAVGVFPRHAEARGLWAYTVFGQLGFVHRVGSLAAFGSLHAGVLRASVYVDSGCGCDGELTTTELVLGPRLGVRGWLSRAVFVLGSLRADLNHFPSWTVGLGLGLGRRPG